MISLSRGDGDTVRIGSWREENLTVIAKSSIVYRTVPIMGRAIPEAETTERFERLAGNRFRISKLEYRSLPGLSDLDYLQSLIRCDRSGWDGHGGERKDFVLPCMPSTTVK